MIKSRIPVLFFSSDPEKEDQVKKMKTLFPNMEIRFCKTSDLVNTVEEILG